MLSLKKTTTDWSNLGVIGSVEQVIAGTIDPSLKNRLFNASDYRYGFEIGSPHSFASLGETVLVNQTCYTTSTDKHDHYQQTIHGKQFCTSGIFIVPHAARPSYIMTPEPSDQDLAYQLFCEKIYSTTQQPALFVCLARFKTIYFTSIQSPPIAHKNIFTHKSIYYGANSTSHLTDTHAFIIGIVSNLTKDDPKLLNELKVVLYQNPLDIRNELTMHTHGLVLNQLIHRPEEIEPTNVKKTIHVYNQNTILSGVLWGEIYVINQVNNLI